MSCANDDIDSASDTPPPVGTGRAATELPVPSRCSHVVGKNPPPALGELLPPRGVDKRERGAAESTKGFLCAAGLSPSPPTLGDGALPGVLPTDLAGERSAVPPAAAEAAADLSCSRSLPSSASSDRRRARSKSSPSKPSFSSTAHNLPPTSLTIAVFLGLGVPVPTPPFSSAVPPLSALPPPPLPATPLTASRAPVEDSTDACRKGKSARWTKSAAAARAGGGSQSSETQERRDWSQRERER